MTNKNDVRILELKKQIQEKKDKLSKVKKFTPLTNMSLELDGTRYNLNVLTKEQAIHLAVKLNSYYTAAIDLGFDDQYQISGYPPCEWVQDLVSRIVTLSKKDEEKALATMEAKLSKMLSGEKQVELELDEIASLLGD